MVEARPSARLSSSEVMEKKEEEESLKDMKLVWLVEPSSVTFEEEEALDELLIVLLMDSILIDLWVVRI